MRSGNAERKKCVATLKRGWEKNTFSSELCQEHTHVKNQKIKII